MTIPSNDKVCSDSKKCDNKPNAVSPADAVPLKPRKVHPRMEFSYDKVTPKEALEPPLPVSD